MKQILQMQLRMEQRLALEQRLEQKLAQQMKQSITLKMYLAQEDIMKGFADWASENDGWRTFDKWGFHFTYAALPHELAAPVAARTGPGFAHCLYKPTDVFLPDRTAALSRGDWMLFVVPEMVSEEELVDFVALHERGEELSLGNHFFASQLEFSAVRKARKVRPYTRYVDGRYPSKFVDLTERVLFPILPKELLEYLEEQGTRHKEELAHAKELFGQYPLPTTVLRFMERYEDATQRVCKSVRGALAPIQHDLLGAVSPEDAADIVNTHLSEVMGTIDPEDARVVSRARADVEYKALTRVLLPEIYKAVGKHINLPSDFDNLYERHQNRERVASASYHPGDRILDQDGIRTYTRAVNL